jgi:uncharacterized C2H2 Zn-finger protein
MRSWKRNSKGDFPATNSERRPSLACPLLLLGSPRFHRQVPISVSPVMGHCRRRLTVCGRCSVRHGSNPHLIDHAVSSSRKVAMPPIAPIKTGVSPVMVICPHCPSQVRQDRLARHIRRYHGLPVQTNGRKTPSRVERAEPSSAFLRTPCSCGGTNENCFKCGGWGYIDAIGVGRSTPVAKGFGRENTYEARFEGRLKNPLTTGSPMHRCPICGITVKRLARHLAKAHPAQCDDRFVSPPSVSTVSATSHALTQCAHCSSMVRADHMARHVKRVHGEPAQEQFPRWMMPAAGGIEPARYPVGDVKYVQSDRSLDGTKDITRSKSD